MTRAKKPRHHCRWFNSLHVSGVDGIAVVAEMISSSVAYQEVAAAMAVAPTFDRVNVIVLVLAFVLRVFVIG